MEELRHLDEVAYVRFASVYRSFQDVDAFREEIERLRHRRRRDPTRPAPAVAAARRRVPAGRSRTRSARDARRKSAA
jgi:hypothetical protein